MTRPVGGVEVIHAGGDVVERLGDGLHHVLLTVVVQGQLLEAVGHLGQGVGDRFAQGRDIGGDLLGVLLGLHISCRYGCHHLVGQPAGGRRQVHPARLRDAVDQGAEVLAEGGQVREGPVAGHLHLVTQALPDGRQLGGDGRPHLVDAPHPLLRGGDGLLQSRCGLLGASIVVGRSPGGLRFQTAERGRQLLGRLGLGLARRIRKIAGGLGSHFEEGLIEVVGDLGLGPVEGVAELSGDQRLGPGDGVSHVAHPLVHETAEGHHRVGQVVDSPGQAAIAAPDARCGLLGGPHRRRAGQRRRHWRSVGRCRCHGRRVRRRRRRFARGDRRTLSAPQPSRAAVRDRIGRLPALGQRGALGLLLVVTRPAQADAQILGCLTLAVRHSPNGTPPTAGLACGSSSTGAPTRTASARARPAVWPDPAGSEECGAGSTFWAVADR